MALPAVLWRSIFVTSQIIDSAGITETFCCHCTLLVFSTLVSTFTSCYCCGRHIFSHTWHSLVYYFTGWHPRQKERFLPTRILYRLVPSLCHLTSPVLLPYSDQLVFVLGIAATFACSMVRSVKYSHQAGVVWKGLVWRIWLHQCLNLPACSRPCRASMQIDYAKPTCTPGPA